jgi:hypothetical protein
MKTKISILSVMFVLTSFFYACNKESDNILSENANSLKVNKTIQGVISEFEFPYILQKNTTLDYNEHLKSTEVWNGPFYVQGTATKTSSRTKMVIPSGQIPGIATGIYICDIYSISTRVNLPTNTIAQVYIPVPCGYYNYNTKAIGINYTQSLSNSGTSLYMQTFTMVIICNMSGQSIGKAWPCSAKSIIFSYSTMSY